MDAKQEFVSTAPGRYKVMFGRTVASSLSGFIAGVIAASIVWFAVGWFTRSVQSVPAPQTTHTVPAIKTSSK